MSRKKKSTIDEILALPYTKPIDGQPYVRIKYRAGKKIREKARRVKSVAEAITAIEQIKQELGLGSVDGERMTFTHLMQKYESAKKIPEWYKQPLLDYFGDRRIRTITYGDIEEFKKTRESVTKRYTKTEKRSPATINRELEALRSVFLYALRHEWILRNPFTKGTPLIQKSEESSRDRTPSPAEEARILEFCTNFKSWIRKNREARGLTAEDLASAVGLDIVDRIERGERLKDREIKQVAELIGVIPTLAIKVAEGDRSHLRPILIAARDTGLRKGALFSLTWSMVGFKVGEDGQTIIGDVIWVPKGPRNKKRPPAIGLTARLKEELTKLWQASDKQPTSPIFGVHEIKRSYKTVCRLAGVTNLTIHDWRHANATDMMEAGVEERLAMRAAGHTSADTHAIYTNIDERLALAIASRLDDLHRRRQAGEGSNKPEANGFIN